MIGRARAGTANRGRPGVRDFGAGLALLALALPLLAAADDAKPAPTMAEVLAASADSDWRTPDPRHTLYLELASGRVVIELAPEFAPRHVANIEALVRERYFDGLAILRSQDNYVVQWGDPANDRAWLAHCYAMVGAGRGDTADSGSGAELYVVIGHSPRHLDRNVTLVGRVLQGMERLSTLPRGSGPLGFHEDAAQHVPIRSIRIEADLPEAQRSPLQVLRTDTETFRTLVEARRTRKESWFLEPTGRIELCNVPVPVRAVARD